MAEEQNISIPEVDEQTPKIGDGQPQPGPAPKLILSDENRKKLDGIVQQMVNNKEKDEDIQAVVNDFKQKYSAAPTPAVPDHTLQHTPIQDLRHLNDLANQPVRTTMATGSNLGVGGSEAPIQADVDRNKQFANQYNQRVSQWAIDNNLDPVSAKQTLTDFPGEQDEAKLKDYATLNKENPAAYTRLKNGNDIRQTMAQQGPQGIHDANVFNHLLNADNYQQLTEENIPYQLQLMRQYGFGQEGIDKLKDTQRPLINSTDPGLLSKYWNSDDKYLKLTPDEYAGLETKRLFNPDSAQSDEAVLNHYAVESRTSPEKIENLPYAEKRGLENIKYGLAQIGRENLARYVSENQLKIDKQVQDLTQQYNESLSFAQNDNEKQQLINQFNNEPTIQEANKLQDAQQGLRYSENENQRLYPLNTTDQATKAVVDAMNKPKGFWRDVFLNAGEQADNTMRFFKNVAINAFGDGREKAINIASNIGHQSLQQLAMYEPSSYTDTESPLIVPRETLSGLQTILNDGSLSQNEKQQKAISYVRDNMDQLQVNPKYGQQNITGKINIYNVASTMGQILGIANQSFLMGGAIGDAGKLAQMANAFTPMYMTTQNQMYEQALQRGDEHPLLRSNVDATILSLASLINPDIKVVKGMFGANSGAVGDLVAGLSEDTWNKVLSDNKPFLDRMTGIAKATGRQLGLANLQYGLIAPIATGLAHKAIFDENPNIQDAVKDGIIQTSISMALPSLLHGVWGGVKATEVNPTQKYAIVEAGLRPDQNIDLIDSKIKSGQLSEIQGHEMKQVIKHAGEILQNSEMKKTDGTPMNEKEVADVVYNELRKKALEGKLKTASGPIKPIIEDKIHEVNKDITDLHTSDDDKQKAELNQLLHDNLDQIRVKMPTMEQPIKDAIAENRPEDIFREIASQAMETTKVDGKEVSSRAPTEEIFGKAVVDKAIELSKQKIKENGKTNASEAEGRQGKVIEKPADAANQGAASALVPNSETIHSTTNFRTWDLGDMEGKPEDEAAKKHLEGVVREWDTKPAGTQGETFGEFINRVIPSFDKILKEEPENTTIVTHSSVLKAFKVWDEMGRPEIDKMTDEQKKEFADAYNKQETHNGDLDTFNGTNGDVHVIRHGQTEDNEKNNFRSGNTNLTKKGINDAGNAGRELKDKTGGDVPKIITSDLPRAIHTSNIINDKLKENAIPEHQAGTVGAHASGDEGAGGSGQGEGMGSSQQGQTSPIPGAPANGEGGALPPKEGVGSPLSVEDSENTSGIKRVISEELRTTIGLPQVEMKKLGSDSENLQAGKEAVDSGKIEPRVVAMRVFSDGQGKGIYTPEEGWAMQYYSHQLAQVEKYLRSALHEANTALNKNPDNTEAATAKDIAMQRLGQLDDEVDLKTRADRINSNSWGGLGNAMSAETDESFSPSRNKSIISENYGGKIPEDVQKRLDQAFAERDKALADLKEAKEKVAEQELKKDADRSPSVAKTIRDKKAALKKERVGLIEELKQAIKRDSNQLGANPLPIHTIEAVSKLALNYFKDGVLSVEGITNRIYDDLKDVVKGIDKNQIREAVANYQPLAREQATEKAKKKASNLEVDIEMVEGRKKTNPKYTMELPEKKPKVPFEKDMEYRKANQRLVNAEFKIKKEKLRSYAAKETKFQKTLGWINRLTRLSVLSGVNVLEKLAAAATIGSASQKPIEETLNGLWGKTFPEIRGKADIDMGANAAATGKYYSEFLNPEKFLKDSKDILKSGETNLGKELEKQLNNHIPILDLPTDLHQVIKAPAKRAMFEYSLAKILDDQSRKGIDINHPLIIESARQRAFARAKYEIFQESNDVSKWMNKKMSEWGDQGKTGALKQFLTRLALPVSTVPTNIARRVGLYTIGLPKALLYDIPTAYSKGIENLTEDEANHIGRALTKGSIGLALWMTGYFGYKSMGGMYTKYDPDKERKKDQSHTLHDQLELMNAPISRPWQHALPFQIMQLGATFRHIYEHSAQKNSDPFAIAQATMGSTGAILDQIPIINRGVEAITATMDPYQGKKLGNDFLREFEPQILRDLGVIKPDKKASGGGAGAGGHYGGGHSE